VANVDKGALLFYRVKNKKSFQTGQSGSCLKKGLVLPQKGGFVLVMKV